MVKETFVGRLLFNQNVPEEMGYVNTLISKKSLRDIIGAVIKRCGVVRSAKFLDDIRTSVTTWHSRVACRSTWATCLSLPRRKNT